MPSFTISGTVRDSGQVARIVVQMREACCGGPVDTLPIVPAVDVPFSVTYSLIDGTSYVAEITAYDRSGNKADTTVQVRSDRSPPTLYVIAPVFTAVDSEFVNVDGIDTGGGALTLAYSVDGGAEQLVDTLVGIPSPYPITPRQYFYATAVRVPIGAAVTRLVLTLRDEAGNGTTREVRIRRSPPIAKIATGLGHWCALAIDGSVWCWGDNTYGQLGTGSQESTRSPSEVIGGISFRDIAAGSDHTCGLTEANALYCWGATVWAIVLNATQPAEWFTAPTPVAEPIRFASIAPGAGHTCGLTLDGSAYCWGLNFAGQLGDSTTTDRSDPTPVAGGIRFQSLTAGAFHTCGVSDDVGSYCWGENYGGKLGLGYSGGYAFKPARIPTSLAFQSLSAGYDQTCGIGSDDRAYCWGLTDDNRLGIGIGGHSAMPTPMPVLMDEPAGSISVFYATGCAIGVSGSTYCWGSGNLGTPFTNPLMGFEAYPILTAYGLPLRQIQTGAGGACALSVTRALYCWGVAVEP